MPTVHETTRNKGGSKKYTCTKCGKDITPGQKYYHWSFRYGGTYRQHVDCGRPRQSQLTQSKMSGVYAAQEGLEAEIESARTADSLEGLADAFRNTASEIENVRDEYQDGYDNLKDGLQQGSTGEEIQAKIEALDSYIDTLNSAADELEQAETELEGITPEPDDAEAEGDGEDTAELERQRILEDAITEAESAAGGLEI